jgi:hypothetical protein
VDFYLKTIVCIFVHNAKLSINSMKINRFVILLGMTLTACQPYQNLPQMTEKPQWKTQEIAATPQDTNGDAAAGYRYLIYGDYVGSGTPYQLMENRMLPNPDTILKRTDENKYVVYGANVFKSKNGVKVFAGNCLGVGGNDMFNLTRNFKLPSKILQTVVKAKYKANSLERQAFASYDHSLNTVYKYIRTPNTRVNAAFRLEEACMMYRNPVDLRPQKQANFEPIAYTLASDIPPLWNVRKKNALYYNGMGRGSMTKLLMQASILGIPDTTTARHIHDNFDDVLAWLKTLKPPAFPQKIDTDKASLGKTVFEKHCVSCHGKYGNEESYPNKLVALQVVKTDPLYALYFTEKPNLAHWYNASWYATTYPKSNLLPQNGYIAPPLDGIWASAPYLHNASVPTLASLLNSNIRPKYWQKTGYDYEEVGLKYKSLNKANNAYIYDTTKPGYSNEGHTFGDQLTEIERKNLMEYLKGL